MCVCMHACSHMFKLRHVLYTTVFIHYEWTIKWCTVYLKRFLFTFLCSLSSKEQKKKVLTFMLVGETSFSHAYKGTSFNIRRAAAKHAWTMLSIPVHFRATGLVSLFHAIFVSWCGSQSCQVRIITTSISLSIQFCQLTNVTYAASHQYTWGRSVLNVYDLML